MENAVLHHVALQYMSKTDMEIFFTKILGLQLEKSFTIDSVLSDKIFGISEDIEIFVYNNEETRFEIFITKQQKPMKNFEHTCIIINNKEDFINRCKQQGLKPNIVDKDGKKLLFLKDFSGNLFEVKER